MFNPGSRHPGFVVSFQAGDIALAYLISNCGLLTYANGVVNDVMLDKTGNDYDWDNDGTNILISDVFAELISADTTNIIYDVGEDPISLLISALPITTNNQLYFNIDNDKILFFEASLSGDCHARALNFIGFSNLLLDESADYLLDEAGDRLESEI